MHCHIFIFSTGCIKVLNNVNKLSNVLTTSNARSITKIGRSKNVSSSIFNDAFRPLSFSRSFTIKSYLHAFANTFHCFYLYPCLEKQQSLPNYSPSQKGISASQKIAAINLPSSVRRSAKVISRISMN